MCTVGVLILSSHLSGTACLGVAPTLRTIQNFVYLHHVRIQTPQFPRQLPRRSPALSRQLAGYLLDKVQRGLDPNDWKPMATVGQGMREIRIRDASGAFRVIYVAKLAEAVYVLHCFQKKTQKTSKADLDLAEARYRALLSEVKR